MFRALKSLGKAAVGLVVETPLAVVADTVTLGGVLTDNKEPYTKTALGKVVENVESATDPQADAAIDAAMRKEERHDNQ